MSARAAYLKPLLATLLCAALAAAAVWCWYAAMEQTWIARREVSDALQQNPMLAATRLLEQHHHTVRIDKTLGDTQLHGIPDGTLFLADHGGQMSAPQAGQLLDWVRRGNTLIALPKWSAHAGEQPVVKVDRQPARKNTALAPITEPDPLAVRYGVSLSFRSKVRTGCGQPAATTPGDGDEDGDSEDDGGAPDAQKPEEENTAQHLTCVTLPQAAYPLALETGNTVLDVRKNAAAPLWGDLDGLAVRAYAEGRGQVVLLSANYFDHRALRLYDHAELLVGLAELNRAARQFTIVEQLDALPWYRILWSLAWPFLAALAALLMLALWRALRRFGPLLPEPALERRSLLEHIDASANWLWHTPGGRDILLAATRAWAERLLERRAPELSHMTGTERLAELARRCALSPSDLNDALFQPAARQPHVFTRQIQILQQVRKHHER